MKSLFLILLICSIDLSVNPLMANKLVMNFDNNRQNSPSLFQSKRKIGSLQNTKSSLNKIIAEEAKRNNIPVNLVHAIIRVESAYNVRAVSIKGAKGLMQLMPDTAKRFGVKNSFNARENIQAGTRYLKFLIKRFNNLEFAIAGYNAGEGAVSKYNGIPPYKETQNYVKKVMDIYRKRSHSS